jgi:transposase
VTVKKQGVMVTLPSLPDAVLKKHATKEVMLHAIYAVEYLGKTQSFVAEIFGKSEGTISRWVTLWDEGRGRESFFEAKKRNTTPRRLNDEHKQWIFAYVMKDPLAFLREICNAFKARFNLSVSTASVFRVITDYGLTKKVIEQRAMEISFADISRFCREVNLFQPLHGQLLFIDEMSTDNRSMLRKRGWFLTGSKPVFRTLFRRGNRLSILSFLGVDGLLETYHTKGTFDRLTFFESCKHLLDSGKVQPYPGNYRSPPLPPPSCLV